MEPLARNGYTAEEVKRALHAPWGARQIEFRYELLDKDNQHKGWLDVEDGTISYNALGEIHRKATLRVRDDSLIEWGVDRVKPIVTLYMTPHVASAVSKEMTDVKMWSGPSWSAGTLDSVVVGPKGLQLRSYNRQKNNFGDYSVGQMLPPGWTSRWYNDTWGIKSISDHPLAGGKVLYHDEAANSGARRLVTWDAAGVVADAEVLALFRVIPETSTGSWSGDQCTLFIRGGGVPGAEEGYFAQLRHSGSDGTKNIRVGRYHPSGFVTSSVAFEWQANTWYWMRFRVDGYTLKVKVWPHGTVEPSNWTITWSDTDKLLTSGYVGVGRYSYQGELQVAYIGVAKDGAEAPGPSDPAIIYAADGTWVLQDVNLPANSHKRSISWEASTPTGTSILVEVSNDGTTWIACDNGSDIPTTWTTLWVRITVATTDITVSPIVELLRVQINYTTTVVRPGYVEFPLGVLLLTTPKRQTDASGARVVEVECYDQIHILKDPIGGTYRIPKGTNIIQAVSSILTAAGITLQNLAPSDKVMPFDREWDANSTRLEIINDLLKAINYFAIYFDANGYAVARPYTLPAEAPIEYEYLDDDISVIELGSVEEHTDFFDVPNRWVLVVSQPDVGNLRAEYVNDNPASPTSTVRRGYVRTKYMEVEAADQATLEALARRQAEIDTSVYQHVRWSSWIMPHHGHMDTYYLRSRRDGIDGKYRETAWQMELRPGGRMVHECRRSVQV